jgi:LDH2 family malate/lactate/ureidoglycolate dehydrogenase
MVHGGNLATALDRCALPRDKQGSPSMPRGAPMPSYAAPELVRFATDLLTKSGLAADRAGIVAEILVEADLMGHTTHGLQLLGPYLKEIETGAMAIAGEPEILADRGAAITWDGNRLPGPWLVVTALDLALDRVEQYGTVTVVIRRSHHIACLAAYLTRATDRGKMVVLTCSDPATASVAPYGGLTRLYTPNPLAAGWPTAGDPVLIDVSMSATTNGLTNRLRAAGQQFEHPWLLDGTGRASRDPEVFFADPPGTILPLGGLDSGHKGYALGILVEALTSGLGGLGRAAGATGWGASIFLQVIDPEAFGGRAAFEAETGWLADTARATPVPPGKPAVRLPGEGGLARRRAQLATGLMLHPGILEELLPWADKLAVAAPLAQG